MSKETEERIEVLLTGLSEELKTYNSASLAGAGFDERRKIRTQIREIETEVERLKGIIKSISNE